VQSSLPEAYTSLQTGVYNGWIMFPSGVVNFKLHEVAKYYTEIGFGAITWHGLTFNKARWGKLPPDVKAIVAEVAREYEARTGTVNLENYPKQVEQLKAAGAAVRTLPDNVRVDWATSLQGWPQEKAAELDKAGLPASQVLKLAIEEAEKLGHKWPVRYRVKGGLCHPQRRHDQHRCRHGASACARAEPARRIRRAAGHGAVRHRLLGRHRRRCPRLDLARVRGRGSNAHSRLARALRHRRRHCAGGAQLLPADAAQPRCRAPGRGPGRAIRHPLIRGSRKFDPWQMATLIGVLLLLVFTGVHIAVALGITAALGIWLMQGDIEVVRIFMANTAYEALRDYVFAVIPLFMLMGELLAKSGAATDLFTLIDRATRRVPGRLGIATVLANAVFAFVTGVSIAAAAAFSRIAWPEMKRHGYERKFALGCIAGSACLGMLIPPSVLMIVWGVLTEQAIGKLFIAGTIPGFVVVAAYSLYILFVAVTQPERGGWRVRRGRRPRPCRRQGPSPSTTPSCARRWSARSS